MHHLVRKGSQVSKSADININAFRHGRRKPALQCWRALSRKLSKDQVHFAGRHSEEGEGFQAEG